MAWTTCKFCASLATYQKQRVKGKSVLTLNEYQRQAFQYALPTAQTPHYLVPGLAEEVGEVASLFAKAQRNEKPVSLELLQKELGDVLWMVSSLAFVYGLSLEDIGNGNISKLAYRKATDTIKER